MTVRPRGLKILFVCTANVARSPYAERRAAQLLAGNPAIQVGSAGVPGYPGRPMDTEMAAILRERGGSHEGHLSRSLTWELTATADLVLTFAFAQQMRVLDAYPDQEGKVLGLLQFADSLDRLGEAPRAPHPGDHARGPSRLVVEAALAAKPNSTTWDIADPYGRGRQAAWACAQQIDEVLQRVVPLLGAWQQGR